MNEQERTFAEATLERFRAIQRKQDADAALGIFQEQAVRDLVYGQLAEQTSALRAQIVNGLMAAHTCPKACRVQAEQTPAFQAEVNREAQLGFSNMTSVKHAIVILERALGIAS